MKPDYSTPKGFCFNCGKNLFYEGQVFCCSKCRDEYGPHKKSTDARFLDYYEKRLKSIDSRHAKYREMRFRGYEYIHREPLPGEPLIREFYCRECGKHVGRGGK